MGTKGRATVTVAVVLLASLLGGAQGNPDFSGTWTQTSPQLSGDSSQIERISQKGKEISVDVESKSSFGAMGASYRGDHTYTIGGPAESKKDLEGRVRAVAVSWDGPRLVFIRTTTEGANTTIVREAWSLMDDGTFLIKDRRTTDWRGTRDEQIVLRRN